MGGMPSGSSGARRDPIRSPSTAVCMHAATITATTPRSMDIRRPAAWQGRATLFGVTPNRSIGVADGAAYRVGVCGVVVDWPGQWQVAVKVGNSELSLP
jgi:hypothetical protein